jgi:hypothetical protein
METSWVERVQEEVGSETMRGSHRFVLPGGICTGPDRCSKVVWMRELTGAHEEVLCDRRFRNSAEQVTELLAQAIDRIEGIDRPVDRDLVRHMLVGDRDFCVLQLRRMTVGRQVNQVVRCPAVSCGNKVDVAFSIDDLPVRFVDAVKPHYEFTLSGPAFADDATSATGTLRLPAGIDQEIVAEVADVNEAAANTRLFCGIITRIGVRTSLDEAGARGMPLRYRQEIVRFIREHNPGPDLTISVQCPYCGGEIAYPFDLCAFFLGSR